MANKERGQATLTVGGRAYTLALTTNALCELEDLLSLKAGKPVGFGQVVQQLEQHRSLSALRAIVWAALRQHHSEVTLAGAGDLIEQAGGLVGGVEAFSQQLMTLMQSTTPDADDAKAANADRPPRAQARKRPAGTGVNSTSSRAASV